MILNRGNLTAEKITRFKIKLDMRGELEMNYQNDGLIYLHILFFRSCLAISAEKKITLKVCPA